MNHRVPEFYSAPSSSQSRANNTQDDEIMDLVWNNGQLGVQSHPKSFPPLKSHHEEWQLNKPPPERNSAAHLFMQEDEMTSWLHYPLDDDPSFDRNLLYHPPSPPPPQPRPPAALGVNFPHFARLKPRLPESVQAESSRNNEPREATALVDSSDAPRSAVNVSGGAIAGTSTSGGEEGGYMMMNMEFADDDAATTADLMTQPPFDDRKRKGRDSPDAAFITENQSGDLEIEAKKQFSETGKRSRATEVHNQSERRRRDRINEKMKALQELIPRCNKTDKASMLDEAIEYLKFLQLQVQMMSMGYYGAVPMMFPGVQQYMPISPIGVGMGMETISNQPMLPFPTRETPSAFGPRFTFPSFPTPPVPAFDPSIVQSNQMDSVGNPHGLSSANVVRFPNLADPYQQYLGVQQMPVQQISQVNNGPDSTPSSSKPSTRKEVEGDENYPNGDDQMKGSGDESLQVLQRQRSSKLLVKERTKGSKSQFLCRNGTASNGS